ncbi:MAG: CoA-binding protein [Thermoproteus sp.]
MALKSLLFPSSVAVIGASTKPRSIGYVISYQLLKKFKGKIYLVNPNYKEGIIGEVKVKFYSSISDIEDDIDLAVIAVPASAVPDVLTEAGRKGVKVAVIVSGGFAEIGNDVLEARIVEIGRSYGLRIVGPNCVGVYNSENGLDTMFLPEEKAMRPRGGPIAFISQSGAVMTAVLDWAAAEGLGIGIAINIGNRADIDEGDILEYLEELDGVRSVALYIEGFRRRAEAVKFLNAAKSFTRRKPLVVYKAGRNVESARAARSHTAALAGNYDYYRALFRQVGAIEAEDLFDLFDIAQALALSPLPKGRKVLVVTSSGGIGVQAVDFLVENGLEVPQTPPHLAEELKKALSPLASLSNPIDLTGGAANEDFVVALRHGLQYYDMALVAALIHPPGLDEGLADRIIELTALNKPIVAVSIGNSPAVKELERRLKGVVPVYNSPKRAARALWALYKYAEIKQRP